MKILALFRARADADTTVIQASAFEEEIWVWRRYRSGMIRELYAAGGLPGVICILEFPSLGQARTEMSKLPMAKRGFVDIQLYKLDPFEGWMALFSDGANEALEGS